MDKELEDALRKVLTAPDRGHIPQAKVFAQAALQRPNTGVEMEGEMLTTHISRVLNLLIHWRGYEAQVVKDVLRRYLKGERFKERQAMGVKRIPIERIPVVRCPRLGSTTRVLDDAINRLSCVHCEYKDHITRQSVFCTFPRSH